MPTVNRILDERLNNFQIALNEAGFVSMGTRILFSGVRHWIPTGTAPPLDFTLSLPLQACLTGQTEIGWNQLLRGFLSER